MPNENLILRINKINESINVIKISNTAILLNLTLKEYKKYVRSK
jgi:hypothetical protein